MSAQTDVPGLLAERAQLRGERDALNQRLREEMLERSALYAVLTMPTNPEEIRAAVDKFRGWARSNDPYRAEVLNKAADVAEDVGMRLHAAGEVTQSNGAYAVMSELRRMAEGGE